MHTAELIDRLSAADSLHTELSSKASLQPLARLESSVLHVHNVDPIDSLSVADSCMQSSKASLQST